MRRNIFILALLLLAGNSLFAQRLMIGLKAGSDFKNSRTNYVYTYRGIAQTYGINQWTAQVVQLPSPTLLIELNNRFSLELSTQINIYNQYRLTNEDDHYSFFNHNYPSDKTFYLSSTDLSAIAKGGLIFYNFELGLSQKINIIRYKKAKLGVLIGLDYSLPFKVRKETTQPLPPAVVWYEYTAVDKDQHYLNSNFANDHLLNWQGYLSIKTGAYISKGPVSFDICWGQSLFTPEKSDNPFFRVITSFEMTLSCYFINRPFKFQKPKKIQIERSSVKKNNYFSFEIFQPVFTNSTMVGTGAYFPKSIDISELVIINEKPDYTNYIGAGIGLNQHLKNEWWLKPSLKINIIKENYKNLGTYTEYERQPLADNIQTLARIDLSSGVRRRILTIRNIDIELEAGLNLDFFVKYSYSELVLKRNLLNLSPYYQTCFSWNNFRFNLGYVHSLFPLFQEHGGANFKNFRNAYFGFSVPLSLLRKE